MSWSISPDSWTRWTTRSTLRESASWIGTPKRSWPAQGITLHLTPSNAGGMIDPGTVAANLNNVQAGASADASETLDGFDDWSNIGLELRGPFTGFAGGRTIDSAVEEITSAEYLALSAVADATYPPCPGDTDGDRVVGLLDLFAVLSNFGLTVIDGPADGDFDASGVVGLEDLLTVLSEFGRACP